MRKGVWWLLLIALSVVFLECLGISVAPARIVLYLPVGWVFYLRRVLPEVQVSWGGVAVAVTCLAGVALLGHALARWLWRETRPSELRGSSRWRSGWTFAAASIVVLMFVCGVAAVGITHQTAWLVKSDQPVFKHQGLEHAYRVRCMSNLHLIGQAIQLYAKEHDGRYPASFEDILLTQDVTPDLFVCPGADIGKAEGKTPEEQAKTLRDHCSYVYHGLGLVAPVSKDRPIACEPLSNHGGTGMSILFGDGSVEYFPVDQAKKVMDRLGLGADKSHERR